jgi:ubiquitin C-terminal hydrolase
MAEPEEVVGPPGGPNPEKKADEAQSLDDDDNDSPLSPPLVRRASSLFDAGDERADVLSNPMNEKKIIKPLMNFEVFEGQNYYLLDNGWFRQWSDWVSITTDDEPVPGKWERPQAIDNSALMRPGSNRLRLGLQENKDYIFLQQKAWEYFFKWYGGGPEVSRAAIKFGKKVMIELYGITTVFYKSSDKASGVEVAMPSIQSKLSDLKLKACQALNIRARDACIWDYSGQRPQYCWESQLDSTLWQCKVVEGQAMLLDERKQDGTFDLNGLDRKTQKHGNVVMSNEVPVAPGVVGLSNLGNTCFMNSTLQCISNVPLVREYFLGNQHVAEINKQNALGHAGKLAESFAELLQTMWPAPGEETVSVVAPRDFKFQIGTFAPQFAGYNQHDSSELMQFLLDGLHEDLNRVKVKPYCANPESQGRPDPVVAAEFLDVYKKRNDSKIVDLFCAQFKTTLVCPRDDCKNIAILFEPYFSVPLPLLSLKDESKSRFRVTVVRSDGSPSAEHNVMVPKLQTAKALFEGITEASGLPVNRMVVCELTRNYIQCFFSEAKSLEWVRSTDVLVAYEVAHPDAFLKTRELYTNSKFKLHQRCECLFKGEWYTGVVILVIPDYHSDGFLYSFRYDVDGLTSSRLPEAKLRFIAGTEPPPKSNEGEEARTSGVVVYFRRVDPQYGARMLYDRPHVFSLASLTSPSVICETVAQQLGVPVKSFTLSVVSQYGTVHYGEVETKLNPEDGTVQEIKERVYLALDWVDGDQRKRDGPVGGAASDEKAPEGKDDGVFDLQKSLNMFKEVETLGENDAWYCNKCKNHVLADKQMELWTTPPVLVLHLKRFSYTRYNRDKLEDLVQFPLVGLDMKPFVLSDQQETLYDLCAVSNHIGSLGGGHYTAYARSSVNGRWYNFDDNFTNEIDPGKVVSKSAYILYYLRRDFRPPAWA